MMPSNSISEMLNLYHFSGLIYATTFFYMYIIVVFLITAIIGDSFLKKKLLNFKKKILEYQRLSVSMYRFTVSYARCITDEDLKIDWSNTPKYFHSIPPL